MQLKAELPLHDAWRIRFGPEEQRAPEMWLKGDDKPRFSITQRDVRTYPAEAIIDTFK